MSVEREIKMENGSQQIYYRADPDVPITFWENMAVQDKIDFLKLRDSFHQNQKASVKDRRLISFSNEMEMILQFTEKNETYRENKCVLIGIAFAGPFICVNTRQLKTFLGRCKSSINGSFQQLGYIALRTKSKARNCVLSVLPSLSSESNLLRQWSVRCASEDAKFCYISHFMPKQLPQLAPEDLFDERKQQMMQQQQQKVIIPQPPPRSLSSITTIRNITQQQFSESKLAVKAPIPVQSKVQRTVSEPSKPLLNQPPQIMRSNSALSINDPFSFDLPTFSELGLGDFNQKIPEMTPSYSVECFSDLYNDIDYFDSPNIDSWDPKWSDFSTFPKSKSFFDGIEDISSIP